MHSTETRGHGDLKIPTSQSGNAHQESLVNYSDNEPGSENRKLVSTVLPKKLNEAIISLGLSRIMTDKAYKFVSIVLLKGMYNNHDLSAYIPLPAHYLEKVFNKEYHKDFFNKMKSANIIQCNEEYKQGSRFFPGHSKGYRINNDLLNDDFIPVFYEDRKNQKTTRKDGGCSKAEIFINRTYFYQDPFSCSSISPSSTNQVLPTTCLSMHISSRLFQKSLITDDLSSLVYNQDEIWEATEERMVNACSNIFIDEEIQRGSFEVNNCLLNFSYHTTKEKAIEWARSHNLSLIQDCRFFYITDVKEFLQNKVDNIIKNYKWQIARLSNGLFYAKRNDTNWRVDHNLTCAGKNFIEVIKEDNDLVEVDIKNSQFAIHAYWMKQKGLCHHEEVQKYYEMCKNGILYDEVGNSLGIKRDAAKQLMFEMVFSKHSNNTKTKKQFKQKFPNVISHIDGFKKEKKDSSAFSIELQQLESEIVVDNLYPNIKELGIFCLTKHDSLIIRRNDEDRVLKLIRAYFNQLEFECVLKIEEREISIVNTKETEPS